MDRRVEGLSVDRDSCWERAARLTVLANEMEAELTELRNHVAQLPPQTFESLGSEARLIFTTAQSEGSRLRAGAERDARQAGKEAAAYSDEVRDAAERAAYTLRTEAEAWGRRTEEAARGEAAELAVTAAQEAAELRDDAAEALAQVRARTAQLLCDQEKRQSQEWDAAGQEIAEREAETDRLLTDLDARGKDARADAQRRYAEAEEEARYQKEDADGRAAGMLAQARAEAERIERATERIVAGHDAERAEVRVHMAHVRTSLAALTGKPQVAEEHGADAGESGPGVRSGRSTGTDAEDTVETQVPRSRGSAES
ncbi:cellulose-binding protein [Streptomyces kronopolitis]|uniref:cellulose-binding protein n=1 Tax=Streptomyces kronopolitis TaxID=1612435 RepID=UPI00341F13D8